LDRRRALQILGLPEEADAVEARSAHRALQAHVTRRLESSRDESFRAQRRAELEELERAWLAVSPGAGARVPRWVLGWAIAATALAVALAVYVANVGSGFGPRVLVAGAGGGGTGEGGYALEGDAADGDEGGGTADARSAGARAKLVVDSPVEGARLEVRTRGDAPELVAEGAADETVYWLAPGSYSLSVRHGDCRDAWQQSLDVEAGDEREFAPELCGDVGWMVVRANVEGRLEIDGREVGSTGERKHPLAPGEHEVRVEKQGYQAWEGIVQVEPGRVLGIRPSLDAAVAAQPKPPERRPQVASAPQPEAGSQQAEERLLRAEGWHDEARRWLLARYDYDRSGELDSAEELDAIPCEDLLGLEHSHDQSRLGLTLTRFYGFDGEGWRSGALGVSDQVRDLAYQRMKDCGLR